MLSWLQTITWIQDEWIRRRSNASCGISELNKQYTLNSRYSIKIAIYLICKKTSYRQIQPPIPNRQSHRSHNAHVPHFYSGWCIGGMCDNSILLHWNHHNDVTWTSRCLTSAIGLFVQQDFGVNKKRKPEISRCFVAFRWPPLHKGPEMWMHFHFMTSSCKLFTDIVQWNHSGLILYTTLHSHTAST